MQEVCQFDFSCFVCIFVPKLRRFEKEGAINTFETASSPGFSAISIFDLFYGTVDCGPLLCILTSA